MVVVGEVPGCLSAGGRWGEEMECQQTVLVVEEEEMGEKVVKVVMVETLPADQVLVS